MMRRRAFLTIIAMAALPKGLWPLEALAEPASLPQAVGVLGREKSAAEQYGVILATIGKKDVNTYLRGVTLYADAKAEFDGLIDQIRFSLREHHDPTKSDAFERTLRSAAEKRIAFTNFVSTDVIGKIEGAKPGLPSIIAIVPELVKAITDSGLSIWAAFRSASKEKQDVIMVELDHLKWRPFAELTPN
jgi:hypothetical protein